MNFEMDTDNGLKPGEFTTLNYSYGVNQYREYSELFQHEDSLQLPCYDYMPKNYRPSSYKVCCSTSNSNHTQNFLQEIMETRPQSTPKRSGTMYTWYKNYDSVLYSDDTLTATSEDSYVSSDSDVQCVPDCTVLTREADGCEEPKTNFSYHAPKNSFYVSSTVSSKSTSSRTSKRSSRSKCSTKPLASSTMIEDMDADREHSTVSAYSHRKCKSPCASSTMIKEAVIVPVPKVSQPNSAIYTCTDEDNFQEAVFQESYVKGHHMVVEPSTAYIKVLNIIKRNYRHAKVSSTCTIDPPQVVPSACHLADDLSVIETSGDLCDFDTDSLYDEDIPVTNSLPRTSTMINLHQDIRDFNDLTDCEKCDNLVQDNMEPEMPHPKAVKGFKLTRTQLKKLFSFKLSKRNNSKKHGSKNKED